MSAQEVRDRPAESRIGMTNVLLSLLIVVSGAFGTMMLNSMSTMESAISSLSISSGVTVNEIKHIHASIEDCEERLTKLESK